MTKLSATTREKLKTVSTATICTALFKRGFRSQMIQGVLPLDATKPVMVGEAFTLRYIPAREDLNPITVFQDRGHPQRKAVEECPPGAVFVIDSRKDARAASAGAILATRLMKRGVAGLVTDGGFRDAAEIARLEMPSFHLRPSAMVEGERARQATGRCALHRSNAQKPFGFAWMEYLAGFFSQRQETLRVTQECVALRGQAHPLIVAQEKRHAKFFL